MHEWAIATSVVRSVEKWSIEKNVKVKKILLSIPSLSMLEVEILKEAFNIIKKDSKISKAKLEVRVRDQSFSCRVCKNEFTLNEVRSQIESLFEDYGKDNPLHIIPSLVTTFVKCPKCGSHDLIVDSSIRVDGIEV
ncbi:MAG: hydrogenase/urease maturation nickel metallochaperone HypA [Nitrososphaerales archaeon]|nr:hydrogenase/urease maturation nickel metallochaperone HypA [Nitrososphaerales archaeon]